MLKYERYINRRHVLVLNDVTQISFVPEQYNSLFSIMADDSLLKKVEFLQTQVEKLTGKY